LSSAYESTSDICCAATIRASCALSVLRSLASSKATIGGEQASSSCPKRAGSRFLRTRVSTFAKATINPVRGTKHRIENNTRVRYLSKGEGIRLLKYVRQNCPVREAEIRFALHSGMRLSEQYLTTDCPGGGLKWEHVDFRSGVISLPRSKHGERRYIPMNSVLRQVLQSRSKTTDSPYVFPPTTPDKWFTALCLDAKIPNFTWHCLRHTFASRLVMAGVDIRTVQELLGHRSIVTTMRYAHLAPKHQADAVERLARPSATASATKPSKGVVGDSQALSNWLIDLVRKGGVEPPRSFGAVDFESTASAIPPLPRGYNYPAIL
jgi:integrase